jgi:hypothetical protein
MKDVAHCSEVGEVSAVAEAAVADALAAREEAQ